MAEPLASETKSTWFKKGQTGEINHENLLPAKEIIRDHDAFKAKLKKFLNLGKVAVTENDLRQQLDELDPEQLREHANSELQGAKRVNSTYDGERKGGVHTKRNKAQAFVKTFSDFIGAYSGIINLVRNAGQQYGEVAYQTLSIFLVVIINKSMNDQKISTLLESLQKQLPQTDTLLSVYPNSRIEKCVASVYKEVILFARRAAQYFTSFSTRCWTAIGRPPSMGIDVDSKLIMGKLAEVNAEAMIILHQNNKKIYDNVIEIQAQNGTLDSRVQSLQSQNGTLISRVQSLESQNRKLLKELFEIKEQGRLSRENSDLILQQKDRESLNQIKISLKIKDPSPETDITNCTNSIIAAFPNSTTSRNRPSTHYEQISPSLLHSLSAYKTWSTSPSSSLLYLNGCTAQGGRLNKLSTYSWLSPATKYIIENISVKNGNPEQEKENIVLYYCCHPENRAESPYDTVEVISSLIFQLLNHNSTILRTKNQEFQRSILDIQTSRDANNRNRVAISATIRLLHDIFLEFYLLSPETKEVYIILDRIDQCNSDVPRLLTELANQLIGDDRCRVKMVVVCDDAFAKKWEYLEDLDGDVKGRVCVVMEWNQRYLESWERR